MPGGKQKQAQRTKGNVRPSSSSRSAELLQSLGGSPGFIGFGVLSDLGYVPAIQGAKEADASVDPDFRMVLRKFSKRDTTTKLKALQEFSAFCQEKDVEAVKSVLPFWPRLYGKLAIDHDRRVREATGQAFEQLVLRVRRNLAPHLKSVMGPWVVAQSDVHAPAASAAKAAFLAAFPPAKQTEAVRYCKEEIITHIHENLNQTPVSLSDPKTMDPEDMESKHQRLLACTLLGWRLLMSILPAKEQESLHAKFTEILKEGKFWKLAKHQNVLIRSSFYSCLASLCQYNAVIAQQFADKICPVVLYNLDESDPVICPTLWEAVLYTVTTIEDCWEKVNPRKGVLPKLWAMLRQGGSGSATMVYPNLLPLLSKIPQAVIGEGIAFHQEFFSSLKSGLSLEKVQVSPSEVGAVVQAFMECLRYCLNQYLCEVEASKTIQVFLIEEQLLSLMEASFVEKNSVLASSPLYPLVVDLLLYLHKSAMDAEIPEKQTKATEVQADVWSSLHNMCIQYVEIPGFTDFTLDRVSIFLITFKMPIQPDKKKSKVMFSDELNGANTEQLPTKASVSSTVQEDLSLLQEDGELYRIVYQMCCKAYVKAKNFQSDVHLTFLAKTMKMYVNRRLLKEIYKEDMGGDSEKEAEIADIFTEILMPWIPQCICPDRKTSTNIVDIIVSVFSLMSEEMKLKILSQFYQSVTQGEILKQFTKRILRSENNPAIWRWFQGEEFGERVVSVTKELCALCLEVHPEDSARKDSNKEAKWAILKVALSSNPKSEPVIGPDYMDSVLLEIQKSLPSASANGQLQPAYLDRCVVFVCDIALIFYSNIKGCLKLHSAEELLLSLFQLSCEPMLAISDVTREKVAESWRLGVKALLHQKGGLLNDDGFLVKAASHIRFRVLNDAETVDRISELSGLALSLAQIMAEELSPAETPSLQNATVVEFIKQLHLPFMMSLITEWVSGPLVGGEVSFEVEPYTDAEKTPFNQVPKCVAAIVFTSQLHRAILESPLVAGTPNSDIGSGLHHQNLLLDIAYSLAFCRAVIGKRKMAMAVTELGRTCHLLEVNLSVLFTCLPCQDRMPLLLQVIMKSSTEGYLWSLSMKVCLEYIMAEKWEIELCNLVAIPDKLSALDEPVVQTLQVTLTYIERSELGSIVEIVAAQLLSAPCDSLTQIMGARGFLSVLNRAVALQEDPLGVDIAEGSFIDSQVIQGTLEEVQTWQSTHDHLFAFHCVISNMSWPEVMLNVEVIKLFNVVVAKMPTLLKGLWDFILCSLASWVQSVHESHQDISMDPATQVFTVATLELVTTVATCMTSIVPANTEVFPSDILLEWEQFFSEGIYSLLLPIFINVTKSMDLGQPTAVEALVLEALGSAISLCPVTHIKTHKLPAQLVAGQDTNLPDDLQTLLNHFCPLLLSPNRPTQLGTYRALLHLMPDLPEYDIGKEREEDKEKEEITRAPPVALLAAVETSFSCLELGLEGLSVGECVKFDLHTEEHTSVTAYLLCWKLLMAFFKAAPSEMKAQYALYLRDNDLLKHLLESLFHLMPETPLIYLKDTLTCQDSQKLSSIRNMFSEPPLLDPTGESSTVEAQHLACTVYHQALQELPAAVRQWWNAQDKKTASIVEKFTSKYASPILCSHELMSVHNTENDLENLSVKVRPAAREVLATYTVQEFSMELLVTLPSNHPLGPISVESGKRIGVTNTLWRNWMLQMTTFLNHQNGSLFDGLMLWKKNVDKRFEGVDDCMICYSVIHNSNYQLPKLTCRVCKKKFHSACLYKWFNTSNNSSCPMCRSLF